MLKLEGVTAQQLYDESEPLLTARHDPAAMSASGQGHLRSSSLRPSAAICAQSSTDVHLSVYVRHYRPA